MGDIADYMIDQMIERGLWGRAQPRPRSAGHEVTCIHCGTKKLEWGNDGSRWYLIDRKGDPHVCPKSTPQEDFA